jgi:hypothetical protein
MTTTTVSSDALVAKAEYTGVRDGMATLEAYIDEAATAAHALHVDPDRPAEYKHEKLAELRATVMERARQDRAAIEERLSTAEKRASAAMAGQQDDPVLETRKARAATRVNRLVDSGMATIEAAQVFAGAGDLDALRVLRDEIPSLVAARTTEHDDRTKLVHEMSLALDEVMRPLLPEAEQFAVDVRLGIADTREQLGALMQYALRVDRANGKDLLDITRDVAAGRAGAL